mgnify:CR=1 FL=1
MIVCSCNVLSEGAVRRAVNDDGAVPIRVSEVFGCLGCRPNCGRCARTIRDVLRSARVDGRDACPVLVDDVTLIAAE